MYRGFKLSPITLTQSLQEKYYGVGKEIYDADVNKCINQLVKFMFADSSLDGTAIQNAWFPQVKADIFISHSHADAREAIIFAGRLYNQFKLISFVDSCIWGYADTLLKEIDEKYCKIERTNSYNYNMRNFSTSHIHMMLSAALSMMIDKTECLFFLDSPNSIKLVDGIEKSESPWIYFEIGMSQVIRKKEPIRLMTESTRNFSEEALLEKAMQIKYTIDSSHLTVLKGNSISTWITEAKGATGDEALDILYKLNPQKKHSDNLHG